MLALKKKRPMIIKRDQTFRVVFNLRTPVVTGRELVGTGIFVAKGDQEIYLITATHVASTCNDNTAVVISDANGNVKYREEKSKQFTQAL